MTEEQRRVLEQQLWGIANDLRGMMGADEFRYYILGLIFYKYLSERIEAYADTLLETEGTTFREIDENSDDGKALLHAVEVDSIQKLGYSMNPSDLFATLAELAKDRAFIIDRLEGVLARIEDSSRDKDSEDDFGGLFADMDLTSNKLGKTEEARNETICKVMARLNGISFGLNESGADLLGDAYEYLLSMFASGAGKKAGEFYTPQAVSTILARIVSEGKTRLKSVYDPACGSGSLLLRVAREVGDVSSFYGQEKNPTTYNLARMNMILHGVRYQNFDIRQDDTLEAPRHLGEKFEAIVANPPFSQEWSAKEAFLSDERFSQYGRLAPKTKADMAFVQHMLHHLDDNGTMAVVLPHGALFRGAAEGVIREFIIREKNWLDAVIGLPANIFYGTTIPTCVLVFKKCRQTDEVLFVDASSCFEKMKKQNRLRPEDIDRIVEAYRSRAEVARFAHNAPRAEIEKNGWNLNIPRYVETFEAEARIDLAAVTADMKAIDAEMEGIDAKLRAFCAELGLEAPV